jgi:heme a synthase
MGPSMEPMDSPPDHSTCSPPRRLAVSPRAFRIAAVVSVWALALTIISGAAVRLTGSGLGCPDWPSCTTSSVVAPLQAHAWIEFGNRLINAFVTLASLGALVAALLRVPKRRDLTLLSYGLLAGLIAEVVLGALVVEFKLAPGLVSAHFLLGLVVLVDAVVLSHRAALPDDAVLTGRPAPVRLVGRTQVALARVMLVALSVVAVLGTVVTSTGPHGGSPDTPRFHLSLHRVAQLHGTSAEVFLGITIVTLWSLGRSGAPRAVMRRAQIVLLALALQAVVGYTQYLNGDPVALVAVHVAGASVLVITAVRFYLGLWAYPAEPPGPGMRPETAASQVAYDDSPALSSTT